jgi:hypothetical protein
MERNNINQKKEIGEDVSDGKERFMMEKIDRRKICFLEETASMVQYLLL